MAIYFVYDIVYAKECANTLLFIEKKIMGIKCGPTKFTQSLLGVVSDIENIS